MEPGDVFPFSTAELLTPEVGAEHVTIWNTVERRKIAGNAAPLRRNLEKYFKKHPECQVYNGQDLVYRNKLAENGGQPIAEEVFLRYDPETGKKVYETVSLGLCEHVAIYNKIQGRKVTGNAAPLRKNLEAYLAKHPECEVYTGQDKLASGAAAAANPTHHVQPVPGRMMASDSSPLSSGGGGADYTVVAANHHHHPTPIVVPTAQQQQQQQQKQVAMPPSAPVQAPVMISGGPGDPKNSSVASVAAAAAAKAAVAVAAVQQQNQLKHNYRNHNVPMFQHPPLETKSPTITTTTTTTTTKNHAHSDQGFLHHDAESRFDMPPPASSFSMCTSPSSSDPVNRQQNCFVPVHDLSKISLHTHNDYNYTNILFPHTQKLQHQQQVQQQLLQQNYQDPLQFTGPAGSWSALGIWKPHHSNNGLSPALLATSNKDINMMMTPPSALPPFLHHSSTDAQGIPIPRNRLVDENAGYPFASPSMFGGISGIVAQNELAMFVAPHSIGKSMDRGHEMMDFSPGQYLMFSPNTSSFRMN